MVGETCKTLFQKVKVKYCRFALFTIANRDSGNTGSRKKGGSEQLKKIMPEVTARYF